jgi:hypothetical protein
VVLIVTQGLAWSVHVWTGSIVLSGIVGLLLSYLLMPAAEAGFLRPSSAVEGLSHAHVHGRG